MNTASRNLYEVFTYKHMAIMSLRSHYHVKASMVLTRYDNLLVYTYIRLLLNNIIIPILMVRTKLIPKLLKIYVVEYPLTQYNIILNHNKTKLLYNIH